MNINNPQHLSNVLNFIDGVNASGIQLPEPDGTLNSTGEKGPYPDCWWDELVQWGKDHPEEWIGEAKGETPNASELIGYHVSINAIEATLIVLSYSQGGFDNCALVPGHLKTMEDIIDYTGIPEEWEVEEESV